MKSFARSAGRIFIACGLLLLPLSAPAADSDLSGDLRSEQVEYLQPSLIALGATAGIYLTSRMKAGPTVFAGLYAMGTMYVLNEHYRDEGHELEDYILPLGLITLAVVNMAVLHDDSRYTHHDVFVYNMYGAGFLAAYEFWDRLTGKPKHHHYSFLMPMFTSASGKNFSGVNWVARF